MLKNFRSADLLWILLFDSLYITFYCTGGHVIAPHFRQHELFRVRQKMIMLISPLSFGVYLLHDHPLVRSYVMTDRFAFITNGSVSKMLLFFFGIILAIFVVGCCVDAVRSKLFQLLHIRKSLSKLDRYFDV